MMSQDSNEISKEIGCFYSRDETFIFVAGINPQKQLMVFENYDYYLESPWKIAEKLQTYKNNPWINHDIVLEEALKGKCNVVDFLGEHESESKQIEDLFLSLKDENRLFLASDVTIATHGNKLQAMKILLRGLMPKLFKNEHVYIPGLLGTVRKIPKNQRLREYPERFRRF